MMPAIITITVLFAMAAIARLAEAWHAADIEACWP